jgi:hypothetical protein
MDFLKHKSIWRTIWYIHLLEAENADIKELVYDALTVPRRQRSAI